MALKECAECGNQVSTTAKACPQCGAKMPRKKWWLWIPLSIFGVLILMAIIGANLPEDKSRNEAIRFASVVKRMMKDPSSFDVVELRMSNIGAICLTYRAKNGFNAYLQNHAVKTADGKIQIDGVDATDKFLWDAYCANGSGRTITVFNSDL